MKKANELHEILDEVIDGLRDNSIRVPKASEISNAVGKRINLIKLELEAVKITAGQKGNITHVKSLME